ncbi:hypothetical protein E2C01_079382 [Portunus trituberculatus]|uniref:Uncharacterized protein n=1 Tax=Portunus trituberculatus TaxID=210409 RepID=A0A5B7IT82_PORTR|nr:hypothetical protein [Portunus trituberculatus]
MASRFEIGSAAKTPTNAIKTRDSVKRIAAENLRSAAATHSTCLSCARNSDEAVAKFLLLY